MLFYFLKYVESYKNNTVTGYAYGAHENIFTTDNNVIFNKDDSAIQKVL